MDYYNKLEEVDKEIEDILKTRDFLIKSITQACNKMLEEALAKLGQEIPNEVKENKRGRRDDNRPDKQ